MSTQPIVVEQTVNAAIEIVWEAITDKSKMKQWYFDLDNFRPEVGFEFSFPGQGRKGEKYVHLCKVTEVISGKKLQYSWRYKNFKGNSLVTFELFDEGGKTRLRLTHEGVDTFPSENPDFAAESFKEGWTALMTQSLPKYLEQAE